MSLYLFYFVSPDGSVPAFDTAEAADTGEALRWGAELLQAWPEREAVEVWSGEERLSTLRRAELTSS